jgi:hypothetical protein
MITARNVQYGRVGDRAIVLGMPACADAAPGNARLPGASTAPVPAAPTPDSLLRDNLLFSSIIQHMNTEDARICVEVRVFVEIMGNYQVPNVPRKPEFPR